jgi:hypothetical protein
MLPWTIAAIAGLVIAVVLYGWREPRRVVRDAPLVVLRAIAITLVLALIMDAPAAARRRQPALVALDASRSWIRGGDSALWRQASEQARALSSDSVLLFGDSVRRGKIPTSPSDAATRARPLAERALGAGRPLVLITDGELDDPSALRAFPSGSRIDVLAHQATRDLAVVAFDAPRAAVSGDTLDVKVTLRNGALPAPAGTLAITAAGRVLATDSLAPFKPGDERVETVRVPFTAPPGPTVLAAVATVDGDTERHNDTLAVAVDVSRAAGAVLVSTSPDFDARFVLPVLRGAVALPTRAYFRVAPGAWRQEGSLAPVAESAVRAALRDAPLAIVHGDTSYFGPPRNVTTGSLALLAPPAPGDSTGEWYATAAPPSPLAAALAGIAWDSLPPITVASRAPQGAWDGLVVARARQFDRRPAIAGSTGGRRVVVVSGSGLWRWQFRGGSSADAYAALWGSIFDWLSAERPDARAAIPADGSVREGDMIRWRRGTAGRDSVALVTLRRRGAEGDDSVMVRFGPGATVAESDPLPAGIYDVTAPGGGSLLVVNASRELLPRAPTVRGGPVGGVAAYGEIPRLREAGWAYLVLIAALCVEWVWRRRRGLR